MSHDADRRQCQVQATMPRRESNLRNAAWQNARLGAAKSSFRRLGRGRVPGQIDTMTHEEARAVVAASLRDVLLDDGATFSGHEHVTTVGLSTAATFGLVCGTY